MVDGADDGDAGLALALSEPYELVVLDLQLPRLDGLRCSSELRRERPDCRARPLGAQRPADEAAQLRLGANDYLSKPFSFDELVARVRVHLRRRRERRRIDRPHRSLELDLARRRAPRRGLRHRSLRSGVPPALPPRVPRRRDREPRAPSVRGVGLQLRSWLERRRRLRPPAPEEARARIADRDRAACGLPAGSRLDRNSTSRGARSRWRASADDRLPVLGDDPVPRHLDQPDAPLRVPCLVDLDDRRSCSQSSRSRPARRS